MAKRRVAVYHGEGPGRYHFGSRHPFGPYRLPAFLEAMRREGLSSAVIWVEAPPAERSDIERFHTPEYVDRVLAMSADGEGFLDYGDTPAFAGVYEAAASVVGAALDACRRLMEGEVDRAFVPIGGLHHARRNRAGGFCVFNDAGAVIEALRAEYGVRRIAYVDIDAHQADGVFYGFVADPELFFVDIHQQGIFPGTGAADERGEGAARGTKRNYPVGFRDTDDAGFQRIWPDAEAFLRSARPEFIIFQCGADCLAGDPITEMRFSAATHDLAARRLVALADEYCQGRLLALGGGGYNASNIAAAWTRVVRALGADAEDLL
jgi:acetoin utilization protein AcuC